MEMSLEELMNITVTSMSKRAQSLQDTAAAVTVITGDDLRRTGALNMAEALRMVPGFTVGQLDSSTWCVSSRGRGYNPNYENKLLFLVDGRSRYCSGFGGVVWDSFDLMLEDVDRVEVIRGPGTSIWGSNAVNGVINIITKSSADTQGLLAGVTYGTLERGTFSLRHGGAFTPENTWRVFAKHRSVDDLQNMDGRKVPTNLDTTSLGFRADTEPTPDSQFMLQGGAVLVQTTDTTFRPDLTLGTATYKSESDLADLHIQASWTQKLDDTTSWTLQGFISRFKTDTPGVYDYTEDMADLDFQYQFEPWAGHTAQWGLGVRHVGNRAKTEHQLLVLEGSRSDTLFSAFIQDEIAFDDRRLLLTLGSKFEHNEQTGLEILPHARLLWRPTENHSFWTAVSRPVRIPSLVDRVVTYHLDVRHLPNGLPVRSSFQGNSDTDAERVLVWELGHRYSPSSSFFLDTAFFATWSDNLFSVGLDPSTGSLQMEPVPHLQITGDAKNKMRGQTHGLEISANWTPLSWWRLHAWYAYLEEDYHYTGDGLNAFEGVYGKTSPRHQVYFRSSMDLPYNTELDVMTRYVSELPGLNIPDYVAVDARLGWKPTNNTEIALVGKNLLSPRHEEITSPMIFNDSLAVERSCYLKFTINF
jgi:iron complex outermembrane receptor protein